MASEYRPEEEYADLLGGRTGEEFFADLQDRLPPDGQSPLPFSHELSVRLGTPLTHELAFPALRRDLTRELRGMVADPHLGLNADEGTIDDLRLGLSEAVQNSFRNDRGVYRIDVLGTAAGGLYTAVHNISVNYPPGPVFHLRRGQRPLRLDRNSLDGRQAELADDEHGWGLGLIGHFALQGEAQNMGFYREKIALIPNISTGESVEITRLVFWSLYGRSQDERLSNAA